MFSDLILIHRPGGKAHATLESTLGLATGVVPGLATAVARSAADQKTSPSHEWFTWQTCLRQIALVERASFESLREANTFFEDDEILLGDEAYRFLLEVICGLHSPLIGETEVYGQFKNKVTQFTIPATPYGSLLKRLFKALFEDAKTIRQAHLKDLGSQSYGSILRRELKGVASIQILGAGQFVAEILPWIAKNDCAISIFARDTEKARQTLGEQKILTYRKIDSGSVENSASVLIVAAPVSHEFLNSWIRSMPSLRRVIDLRADSATFECDANVQAMVQVMKLEELFSAISNNLAHVQLKKAQALAAVVCALDVRQAHVEYRPFGWEDVCA